MARDNEPIILTFGGGINVRTRPNDIDINECIEGENFDLNEQFFALKRRRPFSVTAVAPNGAPVRGIVQLIKQDKSISTLVQAGGIVFDWDGTVDGFTQVGTVRPDAKLRGPRNSNFSSLEIVIITDLNKVETVKQWDGSTFGNFAHNLGVDLFAKYVVVERERAFFGNVKTGTVDTPHVLLGSALGDPFTLSNGVRPSSGIGAADAFFIPMPDLRAINGLEASFGLFVLSTERGRTWLLAGTSAQDFDLQDLHVGSDAAGDEAIVNTGNDIAIGTRGRIDSLRGIISFGDIEQDDFSWWIEPHVRNVVEWQLVYDRGGQRLVCFDKRSGNIWTFHKALLNVAGSDQTSTVSR